ncbi:MAG: cupin domain-containing protein [Nitrososphaerota archaeon]|jgi:quercetin dioxygenase-like cupin family protein|nr:cupin domain-containing protein [Nitrososphaerota archaeon]MDG6953155.1 cupin domain-containing protein [Nitrososphaerota archaeon]MDG6956506.1 cupin domain-containing protein [Nitrososphaerota archaeon]MDG6957298.1 cupin domain-containing protein [Nitrososphaerota archaeon]MDG6960082.1 cupin domain-containing protein [Nitrososphaerota archaeon]
MTVKPDGSVKPENVERAVKTEIEWLVDRHDGAPNFEMRRFRIRPGGSIPRHFHPEIEHEQYVLRGRYKMGIGGQVHEVKAGDSIYIPKGTMHWYQNTGDEDAEFLCIIPKTERYESVYPDEEGRQS